MILGSLALGLHAHAPAASVRPRAAVRLVEAPAKAERQFAGESNDLIPEEPELKDWIDNMPIAMSKSLARQILLSQTKEPEPLPAIWDWFWDAMPFLRAGQKGEPLTLGDVARTFKINIEQIFGNIPAPDKAPLAAADVEGLDFQAIFLALKTYFDRYGSVYKMCFGPKSFMVVNDPVIARHILRENSKNYDKGALALVLEDIMGKGLIPADPVTWAKRRRAIEEAEANFRDATPPCRPGELVDMRIYPEFCAAVLALSEVIVTDEDDKENFNEYMKHKSSFITGRPDVVLKTIKRWPRIRKYWPRIRRRICWCCAREYDLSEPRLWVCGGCGDARYCDEACQAADWPAHKGECLQAWHEKAKKRLSQGESRAKMQQELDDWYQGD